MEIFFKFMYGECLVLYGTVYANDQQLIMQVKKENIHRKNICSMCTYIFPGNIKHSSISNVNICSIYALYIIWDRHM